MISKILAIFCLIMFLIQSLIAGVMFMLQSDVASNINVDNPYVVGGVSGVVVSLVVAMWQYFKQVSLHQQKQNDELMNKLFTALNNQTEKFSEAQKYAADKHLKAEQIRTEGIKKITNTVNSLKKN